MIGVNYALETEGITKTFSGIMVNEKVNFKVKKGKVHALLGENGAGKSTLMNILIGLYRPDEGRIVINSNKVVINSPSDAIKLGIGMVHQHFKLVDNLTVAENIVLGWNTPKWYINKKKLEEEIMRISQCYSLPVQPQALVYQISAGERQRVEILKALYRGAKILILDEPTSILTELEVETLFQNIKKMTKDGCTIIFISHKLNEVMKIADEITILRKGKVIATLEKEVTKPKELIKLMSDKEVISFPKSTELLPDSSPTVMSVRKISALGDFGEIAVDSVSFELKKGEIFGIAGIPGNGQGILAKALTGIKQIISGTITVDGVELSKATTLDFIKAGVGHIPEDRIRMGTIPNFSSVENIILKRYRKSLLKRGFIINRQCAEEEALELIKSYDVRVVDPKAPVKFLSGGNLQKLILAREISFNPKVIVAVHPTYGLDVSSIEMVRNYLLSARKKGTSIILISEDLDEIMELSNSISVIFNGKLSPKCDRKDITLEDVILMMMGVKDGRSGELC